MVSRYCSQQKARARWEEKRGWPIIEYVASEQNDLADLLSRSFAEDGSTRPEVMEEFHARLPSRGLVDQETTIPVGELHRLMCASVEPWTEDQLVHQAVDTMYALV